MESIETILCNVFDKPLRKLTERQRDIAFYYIKEWAQLACKQRKAKASDADKVRATKERIKAERRASHTRPLTETEQAEYAAAWDDWQEVDKDTPTSQSDPAPAQAAETPVPEVTASGGTKKRRHRKPSWATVAMPYMKELYGAGRYKSAAMFYQALVSRAGESDSPFNLQTVDVSMLPADADTLKVSFTLRVLGGTGTPSACNSADYQAKLQVTVQSYAQTPGFGELARRYAHNLANARFLWRNRLGAEQIEVQVAQLADGQAVQCWTFDAQAHSLRDFEASSAELTQLAALLEQGLSGSKYVLLQVTAYVRVGAGQEVFPSQELILDKDKAGKSKTLYKVNEVAAMHSQKIGNAIRTIDTWYPADDGMSQTMPIAVEPYGSVTSQGKAYRQPKVKMDFYSLLDAWVLKDHVPAVEQQHFVMANLVRGGVFGESGKD